MALSSGTRSFLRYGYGDLLKENRRYGVIHRIWPGTQRLLVWGDPVFGAAYGRAFSFCGSDGVEIMEPLTFKGRRGSGIAGDRCGYADASLSPKWDWEKYRYTLRVWGRNIYNPEANAEIWQRALRKDFGAGAKSAEQALANATRILPIITTAHLPSAANNTYWPEMYYNHSLVEPGAGNIYGDTPAPKVFGNVSPLDPQLFLRINDCAAEMLKAERSGRYTPIEVAQWIEDLSNLSAKHLAQFERTTRNKSTPEYRRLVVDLKIQIGLGKFFGAKFRSGVLYGLYERSGDRSALNEAIAMYRRARNSWVELANVAKDVYKTDVTIGELPNLRGHWLDRLPAIDKDIAALERKLEQADSETPASPRIKASIQEAVGRPNRVHARAQHTPPKDFRPGQALDVEISLDKLPQTVRLYYRRVNQGERFQNATMTHMDGKRFRTTLPGIYTESPFPLQYYFEIQHGADSASLYPEFSADLNGQPYFVVRQG